ncbi:serine/threonine protein kinase, CMGC family [Piedraia hortae CBS 480.64]|uniref:cyclin-dependent kinase n=1 Tax=Piedraia hortae CBS 480.64 TaxID=1314780 RepID=A0A6A7C7N5_9PEZI|nr:serine/threonine protein kinase, CMGC family [Piedraia hortae CBS 480.64]
METRLALTFRERVGVVSELSDAYKKAHPDRAAEGLRYAKQTEETIRSNARDAEEYHRLCREGVEGLLRSIPTSTEVSDKEESLLNDRQIGRYTNAQPYRDGLFSQIFEAVEPASDVTSLRRRVALKLTRPDAELPPHNSRREVRILNAVRGQFVVELLETFHQPGGVLVLVFPFLPFALDGLLQRNQLIDSSRRRVLRDLFSGLAHLHRLGIIHRDVKPGNILLPNPAGPAYLADFGIAWSARDPESEKVEGKILEVGTTCYRPVELLFGYQAYGTRLDMWAAGCVAAQVVCLNEKTLFDAGDLGSELALIRSIFENLGTPDLGIWPEAKLMPDWGKMRFTSYEGKGWDVLLPGADEKAVDLVRKLVVYESGQRLSAEEAVLHDYIA